MSEEKKEIRYTTSELLELKEEYDTTEKFEEFIKNYSDNIDKYKGWSEFVIDSYLMDFSDKISTKIIKHGEVEVSCSEYVRPATQQNITFCTVTPEGKKPSHLGFEVPKELFKDFVLLSIAPLTEEEIKKIRVVKILL